MSPRRLLIASSALSISILGTMLAMPTQASAAVITYTFSNDASLTFADGNLEDLSGSFDFNTVGDLISNANITLTGAGPEAGTYDANPFYDDTVFPAVCGSPSGTSPLACVWFQTPLGSSTSISEIMDSPLGGGIGYYVDEHNTIETAVTGDVSYSTPVPEPFTVSLFGAGFAGAVALRRRKKAQRA
jgi:hypothetical protein